MTGKIIVVADRYGGAYNGGNTYLAYFDDKSWIAHECPWEEDDATARNWWDWWQMHREAFPIGRGSDAETALVSLLVATGMM
jgi:hypothetical protein